jgi:hypothetical protein
MSSIQPSIRSVLIGVLAALLLVGCGGEPTADALAPTSTPAPATTPDACAPENLASQVTPIHALMRAFDDTSQVAILADVNQMVFVIPPLQEIRRQAEDLQVPVCVAALRDLEIQYMNSVINTLLVFMQVEAGDPEVLIQGITQGRSLHDQYNQELTRLVGATPVPATATPLPPTATP